MAFWCNTETAKLEPHQLSGNRTSCSSSADPIARFGSRTALTRGSSEGFGSTSSQQLLTPFSPQLVDPMVTNGSTTHAPHVLAEASSNFSSVFGGGGSPAARALPSGPTHCEAGVAGPQEGGERTPWGCDNSTESETAPSAASTSQTVDVEARDGHASLQAAQSLLLPLEFLSLLAVESELPETCTDNVPLATEAVSRDEDTHSAGEGTTGDTSALVEHHTDKFDLVAAAEPALPQTPSAASLNAESHLGSLLAFISPMLSVLAAGVTSPSASVGGQDMETFPGFPGPSSSSCDMELSQKAIRLIFSDLQHVCLPLLSNALSMSRAEAEYVSAALRRHAAMIESVSSAPLPQTDCASSYGFSLLFWPYLSIFKKCLMDCVMPSSLSKFEQIRLLLLVCNTPEPPGAPAPV
ncbi:conserved hypothetical protein [Neospora caninum Liverpool]|nr:conserved hypothetical protein [Neospora caninum Liverpool]CBZ56037.1 conserved hypothetical protein [Neospora caninum Liverpool]|eukprot:XP_003886063.1 conserved hypothetical protein [Neospora caninum Liverpool]